VARSPYGFFVRFEMLILEFVRHVKNFE